MTACNLDYVVMLEGKFDGFRAMFEAHADEMHSPQAGSRKNGSENGAIGISVGNQATVMLVWGLILERIFTL